MVVAIFWQLLGWLMLPLPSCHPFFLPWRIWAFHLGEPQIDITTSHGVMKLPPQVQELLAMPLKSYTYWFNWELVHKVMGPQATHLGSAQSCQSIIGCTHCLLSWVLQKVMAATYSLFSPKSSGWETVGTTGGDAKLVWWPCNLQSWLQEALRPRLPLHLLPREMLQLVP